MTRLEALAGVRLMQCRDCHHLMTTRWQADKARQAGIKQTFHKGRGLCAPCYDRAYSSTAQRRGIDPVVIDRLLRGDPVRSYPRERRLAVAELTRRGLTATQIADRLRCTPRAVVRHRARVRAAVGPP